VQVYVQNTNLLEIFHLRSAVDDEFVDNAAISVTVVKASDGEEVDGEDWPIVMEPFGDESPSQGNYRAVISDMVDFEPNARYIALIDVDAGPQRIAHWEIPFTARERRG